MFLYANNNYLPSVILSFQMYLKTILKEIGHYNTKNPHKNMWELKPEYRHYSSKSDDGGETTSQWVTTAGKRDEVLAEEVTKENQLLRNDLCMIWSLYGGRCRSKRLDSLRQFVDKWSLYLLCILAQAKKCNL